MKKIIIVEDEFRIRNGLSTLINKLDMGCKVIGEAENGFEGLKMISDMEPEVVITDIKMPKMDGLSAEAGICFRRERIAEQIK